MSDPLPEPAPAAAPGAPAPKGSPKARAMTRAAVRHAAPFLVWIGVMLLGSLMHLTPASGTEEAASVNAVSDAGLYAIRTVLCLLALALLRPWVDYRGLFRARHLPAALLVGAAVFVLWVAPSTEWFRALAPGLAHAYETWCVRPFGSVRDLAEVSAKSAALYAPASTGIPLFAVHLVGTGLAIAVAEEFFWRGYLLRAARTPDFLDVPHGSFHAVSFLAVTAVFAAEHAEVAAGFLAGAAYGLLYLRTRDIWAACAAHAATNTLLGLYVLATGHWEFW